MADYSNGLVIVDISNPAAPVLKGSYATGGDSYGVAISGNYAYVADESNGLEIFRIGDTASNGQVHNINKGTDYTTIQAAINAASPIDEIHVDSGTYYENVNVNKKLTLRGIDTGTGMPVVDARGSGSTITLSAEGITIEGFTVTGAGSYPDAGMKVTSSNNTLMGNTASNNSYYGIWLQSSSNYNILYHNNLIDNTNNAYDGSNNQWDAGSEGNYYSDYTGTGTDGDGIGDIPYPIQGGGSVDRYPLMAPWGHGEPVAPQVSLRASEFNSSSFVLEHQGGDEIYTSNTVTKLVVNGADATPINPTDYFGTVGSGILTVGERITVNPSIALTNCAEIKFVDVRSQKLIAQITVRLGSSACTDITPPTLTITSPTSGTTVTTSTLTVSGTASDNTGVASVTVNGILATGTTNWNAELTLTEGANTITVIATDTSGNTATDVITITYAPTASPSCIDCHMTPHGPAIINCDSCHTHDITSPTLTITSPADGVTFTTPTITISGTVSDGTGIASVTVDGSDVNRTSDWSIWSADVTLSEGANTITVVVTDTAGSIATPSITITYTPAAGILTGDVNGDGILSSVDALMALQMSAGNIAEDLAADVSGDGSVTSLDALMILQASVGAIVL